MTFDDQAPMTLSTETPENTLLMSHHRQIELLRDWNLHALDIREQFDRVAAETH